MCSAQGTRRSRGVLTSCMQRQLMNFFRSLDRTMISTKKNSTLPLMQGVSQLISPCRILSFLPFRTSCLLELRDANIFVLTFVSICQKKLPFFFIGQFLGVEASLGRNQSMPVLKETVRHTRAVPSDDAVTILVLSGLNAA